MRDFLGNVGTTASVYAVHGKSGEGARWVVAAIVGYLLATAALLPFAAVAGPALPAATPLFVSGMLTAELATSYLLFAWFRNARTWSLLALASTFLFSGFSLVGYLLSFPDAIVPGRGLFGTPQTAAWLFGVWKNGFAVLGCASVVLEVRRGQGRMSPAAVRRAPWLAAACVAAQTVLTVAALSLWRDDMPRLIDGSRFTAASQAMNASCAVIMLATVFLILAFLRDRGKLFPWFAVTLTAMSCANALAAAGGERYTLGWSAARLCWFASGTVLFIFFVHQFARQQRVLSETSQSLEAAINEQTKDLRQTVQQRDLLLREVYHRVKNNLQVVDSLIAMESRRLSDRAAREALAGLRNRVFALGLVHQQLMSAKNMETFSIAPFLTELCDNIIASVGPTERRGRMAVETEPVMVNLDYAIPIGLLTTELLTNAIRHAEANVIAVTFRRLPDGFAALQVADDGEDTDTGGLLVAGHTGTSGRIIEGLTHQLDGQMEIERDNGLRVKVLFPLPEVA